MAKKGIEKYIRVNRLLIVTGLACDSGSTLSLLDRARRKHNIEEPMLDCPKHPSSITNPKRESLIIHIRIRI